MCDFVISRWARLGSLSTALKPRALSVEKRIEQTVVGGVLGIEEPVGGGALLCAPLLQEANQYERRQYCIECPADGITDLFLPAKGGRRRSGGW